MEPLHRVWMQVYFQVLSEISQMMNVLQILAWWMVKEEVADRLNSKYFFEFLPPTKCCKNIFGF